MVSDAHWTTLRVIGYYVVDRGLDCAEYEVTLQMCYTHGVTAYRWYADGPDPDVGYSNSIEAEVIEEAEGYIKANDDICSSYDELLDELLDVWLDKNTTKEELNRLCISIQEKAPCILMPKSTAIESGEFFLGLGLLNIPVKTKTLRFVAYLLLEGVGRIVDFFERKEKSE